MSQINFVYVRFLQIGNKKDPRLREDDNGGYLFASSASIEEALAEGFVPFVCDDFRTIHLDYLALVGPLPGGINFSTSKIY